ncbi:hypothetical protein [Streptomyces sp. NPDC001380]|uniref:hypothetical protein n=1 Tax=Streptomyces sp. NPDC001380 TaxID=3364566 RepID=UPI0036887C6D
MPFLPGYDLRRRRRAPRPGTPGGRQAGGLVRGDGAERELEVGGVPARLLQSVARLAEQAGQGLEPRPG